MSDCCWNRCNRPTHREYGMMFERKNVKIVLEWWVASLKGVKFSLRMLGCPKGPVKHVSVAVTVTVSVSSFVCQEHVTCLECTQISPNSVNTRSYLQPISCCMRQQCDSTRHNLSKHAFLERTFLSHIAMHYIGKQILLSLTQMDE